MRPIHYARWNGMMSRCYRPKDVCFHRYGGRGIRVCREWQKFEVFQAWCLETYESGKTLNRKNNSRGYSAGNCNWATPSEQAKNRLPTSPDRLRRLQAASLARRFALYGDPETRREKKCGNCETTQPVENFYVVMNRGKQRHSGYCRPCTVAQASRNSSERYWKSKKGNHASNS